MEYARAGGVARPATYTRARVGCAVRWWRSVGMGSAGVRVLAAERRILERPLA